MKEEKEEGRREEVVVIGKRVVEWSRREPEIWGPQKILFHTFYVAAEPWQVNFCGNNEKSS